MNTDIPNRLRALRECMKEQNISACIIPSEDCHMSEYVNDCFKYRQYYSGFTGSAGTLYITSDKGYLITDGRYFLQAEAQLEGTGIKLVRDGVKGEPDIFALCKSTLGRGDRLFSDGRFMSASFADKLSSLAETQSFDILTENSPVIKACNDLPLQKFSMISELPIELTGASRESKLSNIRAKMSALSADGHVISSLEEIAWILNLRGSDIKNTPVFYAYMYITATNAYVFLDSKASSNITASLDSSKITVLDYSTFYTFIKDITEKKILCDTTAVNAAIISAVKQANAEIIERCDPAVLFKAVKNAVEIENLKRIHLYDGLAVTRFMHLIKNAKDGEYTEISAADKLRQIRGSCPSYNGDSFDTICGYGANAAIVHYSATPDSDTAIMRSGALLVDSGGQYKGGTTDITRVFVLGDTSYEFKLHYTLVCKAMLRLQKAVFQKGTRCAVLDAIARQPLWEHGLDFRHGTGHGIGYMLSVHEGPNRFHYANNAPAIEAGMVTSDEPGLYIEGSHGIRIENEILCVNAFSNDHGDFLKFEPLTVCPIDLDAVLPEYLDESDIKALNDYHAFVFENLFPLLEPDEHEWFSSYVRRL
ncbi:MAG: aminopeptidase P family protein [Clostridia bacterium]|nr:aminopeptidase P family protein [Clostridia bacterium]